MKPIQPAEKFVDLSFPRAGIDLSMAFGRQPNRPAAGGEYARTTRIGENVRTYEPESLRARGGSRSGLVRYINAKVNGTSLIQELNLIVVTGDTPDPEPPDEPPGA